MKKLAVVIAALVAVGGAAWLGGTWYVGKETETIVRAQIEQANEQSAAQGIRQELVSYDRSLLGADAVTRVLVTDPLMGRWLNNMQFNHKIKHGPVLFGNGVGLGVSHWSSRLDTASLPAESKGFVEKAFAGKEPFVTETRIGFDKIMHATATFSPLNAQLDETGANIKWAGADFSGDISVTEKAGPFSFKANTFEVRDANTTFTVPSMDVQGRLGPIAGGLENFTMKMPAISLLTAGETQPITMDIGVDSTTTEQNNALQGSGAFHVTNIQGKSAQGEELPVKQLDLKVDYAGFKLEGLKEIQALQVKIQALQEKMLVDETATELPEGQKQQQQLAQEAQQLTEELLDVVLNKVLQAGQSKLRYDVNVQLAKGKVAGIADLTYAGSATPLKLNDLMLYGPQEWGRLVTGSLELTADKAAVPEDLGMLMGYPLEQKAIVEANDQYKLQLKLLGEKAELNGTPIEFTALPAKFFPQMPSMAAPDADLGIPPDLMKQIQEQGMTPEIMQQLEESDDVPKETLEMLKQLQQMNTQAPQ